MTPMTATLLPSIQGEQQAKEAFAPLTDQEADEYVDSHSDEIVDCRMTMRHIFPRPRRGQIVFNDIDREGNFIAEYTCSRCGCATRREVWAAVKKGRRVRWEFLHKTTDYHRNKDGETYLLPPGMGRGRPLQFRESMMSAVMENQSPAAIRKAIERQRAA